MRNSTYICIDCRRSRRGATEFTDGQVPKPHCTECGQKMRPLSTKWRIPPRSNLRAWKDIRFAITSYEVARDDLRARFRTAASLDAQMPVTKPSELRTSEISTIYVRRGKPENIKRFRGKGKASTDRGVRTCKLLNSACLSSYDFATYQTCGTRLEGSNIYEILPSTPQILELHPENVRWLNHHPTPWILQIFKRKARRHKGNGTSSANRRRFVNGRVEL